MEGVLKDHKPPSGWLTHAEPTQKWSEKGEGRGGGEAVLSLYVMKMGAHAAPKMFSSKHEKQGKFHIPPWHKTCFLNIID